MAQRQRWGDRVVLACGGIAVSVAAAFVPVPQRHGIPTAQTSMPAIRFGWCDGDDRADCVVDGDTFRLGGETIRIADIDTPETHPPRCAAEAELGRRATARLRVLLNAGPIALETADRPFDRYGRRLAVVRRHGRSIGDTLVAEGLARRWDGSRDPWCYA